MKIIYLNFKNLFILCKINLLIVLICILKFYAHYTVPKTVHKRYFKRYI